MVLLKVSPIYSHIQRNMRYMKNRSKYLLDRVGHREMVCFGINGQLTYIDSVQFPFPAIRYKETNSDLQALYQKQKGDWKRLTVEEKKTLYRSNFCQTFAEFTSPRGGEWMGVVGIGLIFCSLGVWLFIFYRLFCDDPLPDSFLPRRIRAQLRRRIDMQEDPITGLASNWDYERGDWKVKTWLTPENPFVKCPDDDKDK